MNDFNKIYGGTLYYDGKEDNSYGSNKIYIVAGERNIKSANTLGGLYANVGQTTRRITDRLSDDDYKRKAAGGRWISLFEHSVGNSISDKDIHIHLKQHPFVKWDRDSNNTEEFLFCNDLGDGAVAKEIVLGILKKISIPMMQEENTILVNKNASIVKELNEANEKIKEMLSIDYIHNLVTKVNKLESKLISDKVVISELRGIIEMREGTIRRNGENIALRASRDKENRASLVDLENKVNNAENNAFFLKAGAICSICALCIFSLYFAYTLYVVSDKYEETIHNLESEVKSLKIMNEGAAKYIEESKKQADVVSEQKYAKDVTTPVEKQHIDIPSNCNALGASWPPPVQSDKITCVSDEKIIVLSGNKIGTCSGLHVTLKHLDNSILASCHSDWHNNFKTIVTIN